MQQMTLADLAQTIASSSLQYEARTLIDNKQYISANLDLDFFLPNGGKSHHSIYVPAYPRYIGCVWRYAPNLPYQIAVVGHSGEPRTIGEDFEEAVEALVRWREQEIAADKDWIHSFQISK